MMLACIFVCATAASAAGVPEIVSATIDDVEVTVYRESREKGRLPPPIRDFASPQWRDGPPGFAMITERRSVELPRGRSVLRFRGVANAIRPESAALEGLPATVAESNFDYDLLTPATLIARSVGEPVTWARTDPETGNVALRSGVLRSGPEGVLIEVDGRLEALGCSGAPEKLVFEGVPERLADQPTLAMTVVAPAAGSYDLELSYLAEGFDWSADYVAKLHPDGRRLDLGAWVTLVNGLDTSIENARANVVAGTVAREQGSARNSSTQSPRHDPACWPIGDFASQWPRPRREMSFDDVAAGIDLLRPLMSGLRQAEATEAGSFVARVREFADYKLYSLPQRTHLAPRQIKQVRLLDRRGVEFEALHRHRMDIYDLRESQPPQNRPERVLRLVNRSGAGLGVPLPAGRVSVMEADAAGGLILAGEDELGDVPAGATFELSIGIALGVIVDRRIVAERSRYVAGRGREVEHDVEALIANDKRQVVRLLVQHERRRPTLRVTAESAPHRMVAAGPEWTFDLQPGERAMLRYTVATFH